LRSRRVESVFPRRPKHLLFGVLAFAATLAPTQAAYQDLGALLVRQPAVIERWHKHIIASPFGTIHVATFSFGRPIGTHLPRPPSYTLAKIDPDEITGSISRGEEAIDIRKLPPIEYPRVDRTHKGDMLALRHPQQSSTKPDAEDKAASIEARIDAMVGRGSIGDDVDDVELPYADVPPPDLTKSSRKVQNGEGNGLFFGVDPLSTIEQVIAPWSPGEAPVIVIPKPDPDIKLAALSPSANDPTKDDGASLAPKGEVTGADHRPKTPAERLGLEGKARAKAEKCLANAVYFESRGEPVRGQMAVAQVVMNRVFSPFYPNDVCSVVYQNAHRHLACQFTFACDGIPDVVTEPDMWVRAKRIAHDTLDGKLWVPEIGKSTHYHAYWVRPSWVGEMKKMYKLGVHTFYRPRAWGDGSDEPKWGDPVATLEAAKTM